MNPRLSALRASTGALLFWCASLAVGLAAFAALAVLARSASTGGLADASAVISTSFVTAVFPGAVQLRAAAAAADGVDSAGMPRRAVAALTGLLLIASPAVALGLTVPVLSIVFLAVQLPIACHVAVQRGIAIGRVEHGRASVSLGTDAAVRLVAGVILGLLFGAAGFAAALLLGTVAAAVVGRDWYATPGAVDTRRVVAPALTVGLLMLLVNLDVLAAPRVLGAEAADVYAVAELPAKSVFFALFAVSWLAVPIAVRSVRRLSLLAPVGAVLLLGTLATAALDVGRPLLTLVLGDPEPAGTLLVTLGLAMTAGAGLATALSMSVARGAKRPWAWCLATTVMLAACILAVSPDADQLAFLMLAAQCVALAGTLVGLLGTVTALDRGGERGAVLRRPSSTLTDLL